MKTTILYFLLLYGHLGVFAQGRYAVADDPAIQKLFFSYTSPAGYTRLAVADNPNLLNLFGEFDNTKLKALIKEDMKKDQKHVRFKVGGVNARIDDEKVNVTNLDDKVFNKWDVYLSKLKPVDLRMTLGFGKADLDLSGAAVEQAKIVTQKADVAIRYAAGVINQSKMKALDVDSDFGSISVYRAEALNTGQVNVRVGVGDVTIEYTKESLLVTHYTVKVDKGSVRVVFPGREIPIKVVVNKNPLSDFKYPAGFSERNGAFVNKHYYVNAPKAVIMTIDVSWGDVEIVWGDQ